MYQNKFVVAIKHNGKILREIGDVVKLPFGSEFTVLVKNLNSRRAKFVLHIDGTDVLDGTGIVVNANSETEIKRFVRNGNLSEGNAFKFIERTQSIEDGPRGIKSDDGIVRVEWWFEKEVPEVRTVHHNHIWWDEYYRYRTPTFGGPYYTGTVAQNSVNIADTKLGSATSADTIRSIASAGDITGSTYSAPAVTSKGLDVGGFETAELAASTAGITVPGSKVEQTFTTVYGFNPEVQSQVIILRLVGKTSGDVEVTAPVTVKTKNKCVTCGRLNKANAKFCTDCGTALELL